MELKPYKKEYEYSYALGAFPTIELLTHKPQKVLMVLIHSSFTNKEVLDKIKAICSKNNINIVNNDKLINKLSPKENCYIIGVFKKYSSELNANVNHVLLDNPSDMGNLGTIIRSSLGFGIQNIGIIRPGVDIFNPKVVRASMGAIFNVNIEYFNSYEEYKEKYNANIPYSFMLQASKTLQETIFPKSPVTLVFGNEATGLDIKYLTNNSVIIKHTKNIDSLNLPSAVGIAIYELIKQQSK